MLEVRTCIRTTPKDFIPVVIFMTDGEDSGFHPNHPILNEINELHSELLFFTIGIGQDVN